MKPYVNRKKFSDCISLFLLFAAAILLLTFNGAKNSFTQGLKLWYACVLPTLFPYLFITAAISENSAATRLFNKLSPLSEKLFNVNGNGLYAFFISAVSGYPIGAKTVADLYKGGAFNNAENTRAAAFCSTSSPVFTIVAVGSAMFNNVKLGILLFLTHIISAITVGVIFSFYKRKDKPNKSFTLKPQKSANFLYECAEKSVLTVLVVGGIMAVFYVITDFFSIALSPVVNGLCLAVNDQNIGKGIFFAFFECTKGLKFISSAGITYFTLPLCAAICGFGGLSVIVQSLAFLKSAKIKTAVFVFAKLLTAVINFIIGLILSPLLFV
ncbi:MAG: hypothetical protein SPL13_01845 [Clostridia bacterium]|nr:hypothetical protein [Clostridia bacterium]